MKHVMGSRICQCTVETAASYLDIRIWDDAMYSVKRDYSSGMYFALYRTCVTIIYSCAISSRCSAIVILTPAANIAWTLVKMYLTPFDVINVFGSASR